MKIQIPIKLAMDAYFMILNRSFVKNASYMSFAIRVNMIKDGVITEGKYQGDGPCPDTIFKYSTMSRLAIESALAILFVPGINQ
jgi:hypothetical protein